MDVRPAADVGGRVDVMRKGVAEPEGAAVAQDTTAMEPRSKTGKTTRTRQL